VLAGSYNWLGRQPRYTSLAQRPWWLAFSLFLMISPGVLGKISDSLFYLLGQSIANVGVFLLIDRCVRYPNNRSGTILNWRPLTLIGTWSYSIYLWQELYLPNEVGGFNLHFPVNIIAALVTSARHFIWSNIILSGRTDFPQDERPLFFGPGECGPLNYTLEACQSNWHGSRTIH